MSTIQSRRPGGIPVGGQFAPVTRPEADIALHTPTGEEARRLIRIPSDRRLHALVFEDSPANEEARSYTRTAVRQVLDGDFFDAVYTESEKADILEEADRDDSIHEALDRLAGRSFPAHHFGVEAIIELQAIRAERDGGREE